MVNTELCFYDLSILQTSNINQLKLEFCILVRHLNNSFHDVTDSLLMKILYFWPRSQTWQSQLSWLWLSAHLHQLAASQHSQPGQLCWGSTEQSRETGAHAFYSTIPRIQRISSNLPSKFPKFVYLSCWMIPDSGYVLGNLFVVVSVFRQVVENCLDSLKSIIGRSVIIGQSKLYGSIKQGLETRLVEKML